MFVSLDLNRKNINRAISDNMLKELGEQPENCNTKKSNNHIGMNTNDFNYGQTVCYPNSLSRPSLITVQIFLATFLFAELPSGLISKKVGADR